MSIADSKMLVSYTIRSMRCGTGAERNSHNFTRDGRIRKYVADGPRRTKKRLKLDVLLHSNSMYRRHAIWKLAYIKNEIHKEPYLTVTSRSMKDKTTALPLILRVRRREFWLIRAANDIRCLDDDDNHHAATLTFRRRQLIERCHEARSVRHPDLIPEVSVKRTREELAKYAAQTLPLNRRLNVESGWSKVEEVRKKFEGAAASASFSRSFESPPRRRLADSLFASFKLPRKKDGMSLQRSLAPHPQQKRKSAVELLAESKAFYVKSETVLDRKQELPLRVSSGLSQAIAAGGCHLVSSAALNSDACCNPYATTRSIGSTRRAISAGEGLQNTLRRLLEHSDSRENVYSPAYATHKMYSESRRIKDSYPERELNPRSQHTSGTFSGTSSSGTSGSKAHKSDPEKMIRPLSFGDARVFFPESFVIPRQRPSEVVIKSAFSIPSSHSSPENIELPEPVPSGPGSPADQLGAISPPAQYAHSAPRYIRSNSHSQPSVREEDGCININSHKSLPDLHTQVGRGYTEHTTVPTETIGSIGRSPRRRRHSNHQRTASCSSKGTRSNHSSLMSSCEAFSEHPSPGEDNYQSYNSRCGSSFARDSGGSSGHYTQRSAPPHARRRTDSGSSTQHEHRSVSSSSSPALLRPRCRGSGSGGLTLTGARGGISRYNAYYGGDGSLECYVSAPPQFQDGAPSPPPHPPAPYPPHTRVGIHFQASAPPPQFQDDPVYDYGDYECTYKTPLKCLNVSRKEYANPKDYTRYHEPNMELINKQPQYQEPRMRPRIDDTQEYVNTAQICPPEEVTSPLGTFKRQRCLRYKQRRPRPILRSKSDISDRYRRTESGTGGCEGEEQVDSGSEGSTRLRQFFEHLGLEPRQYDAIVRHPPPDSPVFFSSASTVDSNQLTTAADYTVQGPGAQKQIYRNTEPPSVVERNARIIKWLCQCRKTQMQPPH
ncbi:unnamed protein product [Diatraea saccharalis]|uniref:Centrosome-associated FAM110 C-terminal domain-containing protein n=1 Tax=Diatraea saccharalis TaxID=40085 RepID=A0A9N9RAK8_9NEOP|nr:unnamed protein product [Diatraea saccharalis]